MSLDSATYEAALDPSHPFNPLLKSHPVRRPVVHQEQDRHGPAVRTLLVRKALAHGADMRSIVKAVWGPLPRTFATGLISPLIPCHNPDAPGHTYDPELARQELAYVLVRQCRGPAAAADRPGQAADGQHGLSR